MAPALIAPLTAASSSTLVSATTSTSGSSLRMASVAAMPSIFGIKRSIRTTSGLTSGPAPRLLRHLQPLRRPRSLGRASSTSATPGAQRRGRRLLATSASYSAGSFSRTFGSSSYFGTRLSLSRRYVKTIVLSPDALRPHDCHSRGVKQTHLNTKRRAEMTAAAAAAADDDGSGGGEAGSGWR